MGVSLLLSRKLKSKIAPTCPSLAAIGERASPGHEAVSAQASLRDASRGARCAQHLRLEAEACRLQRQPPLSRGDSADMEGAARLLYLELKCWWQQTPSSPVT